MLIALSVLGVISLVFVGVTIELLPADLDWQDQLHLEIKSVTMRR